MWLVYVQYLYRTGVTFDIAADIEVVKDVYCSQLVFMYQACEVCSLTHLRCEIVLVVYVFRVWRKVLDGRGLPINLWPGASHLE